MEIIYADTHKEIVEQCKKGDSTAQFKLYKLYAKAMFNICFRMVNNREEAEDLLQESFSEAFAKLDTFRYESSIGAWLKRIVINRSINALKKKKAKVVLIENIHSLDREDDFEEEKDLQFEVQKVQKAIEKLPDGFRVIFTLYAMEGYDHVEISEILGISESTSKTQYLRAKRKLKEMLN